MIYFTSDLHLGHTNIIKYTNRPFASVEEMNRKLIENWNATVSDEDQVFVLGDLTMRTRIEEVQAYLSQLKGNITLVKGNHDYFTTKQKMPFVTYFRNTEDNIPEEKHIPVYQYKEMSYQKAKLVLMHYPFMEWNGMNHDSIDLHGHIHTVGRGYNINNRQNGLLRYDVGVDANNYRPVSIEAILNFFSGVHCKESHHTKGHGSAN